MFTMSVPLARLNCHGVRLVPRTYRRVVLNTRQSSKSAVSETAKQNLSWPDYLEIRRSKRKWETVRHSSWNSCTLAHKTLMHDRLLPFQHVFLDSPEGSLILVPWRLTRQSLSWCVISCCTFEL